MTDPEWPPVPLKVVPAQVEPSEPESNEPESSEPESSEPEPTVPDGVVPAQAEPGDAAPDKAVPTPTVPSEVVRAQHQRPLDATYEGPLLGDIRELRDDWQRIKASFVDDPRSAANDAAGAVDEAAQRLIAAVRDRRRQIRETWDGHGATRDTEAMRLAVLRYQALFRRLVGDETGGSAGERR